MADILRRIVEVKREEVAAGRRGRDMAAIRREADAAGAPRDFVGALQARVASGAAAVIAEIKKASPSKGVLRADFRPAEIAASYERHGAAALSVLTDARFFQGSAEALAAARTASALPALRKDFLVDPWQLYESRAIGADAVLLIAAVLDDVQLADFEGEAIALGMGVLVEVHDERELDARIAPADAAPRHQQSQPAQLRGVARDDAGHAAARPGRTSRGHRERHPRRRRRPSHAAGGRRRLPGRRGVHARRRSGRGAGAVSLA